MPNNHYNLTNLTKFFWLFLLSILSGCAFAPWDKPSYKQNQTQPEQRVSQAEKASEMKPDYAIIRKDLLVTKELAVTQLFEQAEQALVAGKYQEAKAIYERVLAMLPDNPNAISGKLFAERTLKHVEKLNHANTLVNDKQLDGAKKIVRDVLLENPQLGQAVEMQAKINAELAPSKIAPPQLKPASDKQVTLELRDANIKIVFEALSRATGINFILDKDIKPETKATIFIKKARVEDAIDMVLSSNGLQKKALSENSALVFPATPQKLKDYQELMIRSFYFSNSSAKQASEMLKTMLKIKDIYVDDRLNMLVIRDKPEVIRIAEKLVAANDLEDPEVMLDIEVLEVSRNRLQELGIIYPNQLSVIGAGTGLTLEALKNVTSQTIGVSPNPAVNFKKTTGDVNLLSNPRIRVRNNEKAKILVGDKVPIITTTSTANVGISENVQYIDVGLKLDVEPRITLNNFVNIKIGLEVSSLGAKTVTRNGAEVFTIGTRNANTVLRLKNGETQILAGLILDDERKSAQKLPGFGDIPLIGRLFSNQEDKKTKTEIVLAITPRVIGNISLPDAEISEYWSGTEAVINDKPQINYPVNNNLPLTPIERMKEQMRLRQQQQEEASRAQDAASSSPAEIVPPVAPVVPAAPAAP